MGPLSRTSVLAVGNNDVESRISRLEREWSAHRGDGMVAFLFGAFCALWAQNTGRSAWLWFFLGLFFSCITVFFLLIKNSDDRRSRVLLENAERLFREPR